MKFQILFSGKNKKISVSLLSADFAQWVVMVKVEFPMTRFTSCWDQEFPSEGNPKNVSMFHEFNDKCSCMYLFTNDWYHARIEANKNVPDHGPCCIYGKCPKISYTKVSDKKAYANSVDPDQTAPWGAVSTSIWCKWLSWIDVSLNLKSSSLRSSLIRVYIVCHSTKYFKKLLHKKQNLGQKCVE